MNPFVSPRWKCLPAQPAVESLSEPTPTPTPAGASPGQEKPPRNPLGPAGAGKGRGCAFHMQREERGMGKETETDPTSFSEM